MSELPQDTARAIVERLSDDPRGDDAAYRAEQEALARKLEAEGACVQARVLPDGSIAVLQQLLTTVSIALGVDEHTWRFRFCFKTEAGAREAFDKLQAESDVPDGWIATRPEVRVIDNGLPRYPTPDELRQMRAFVAVKAPLNPGAAWPFPPKKD